MNIRILLEVTPFRITIYIKKERTEAEHSSQARKPRISKSLEQEVVCDL